MLTLDDIFLCIFMSQDFYLISDWLADRLSPPEVGETFCYLILYPNL